MITTLSSLLLFPPPILLTWGRCVWREDRLSVVLLLGYSYAVGPRFAVSVAEQPAHLAKNPSRPPFLQPCRAFWIPPAPIWRTASANHAFKSAKKPAFTRYGPPSPHTQTHHSQNPARLFINVVVLTDSHPVQIPFNLCNFIQTTSVSSVAIDGERGFAVRKPLALSKTTDTWPYPLPLHPRTHSVVVGQVFDRTSGSHLR